MEQIRTTEPVTNTVHNLIQTLSVKLDSAARYDLYVDDARKDGCDDCAEAFRKMASLESEAISLLLGRLQTHLPREQT